jgi:dTDP-4-amino-4,6-dideoxygalactose transaminase
MADASGHPNERIYLSVPHMSGLEQKYVEETFESNWLSTIGPQLDAFEREMSAELGGTRHGLAVASGTAALHLVLRDLGVGAGDRVAVSTLTFAGSVYPILYQNAAPVLIDSETQSGNMDPDLVDEYLDSAVRRGTLPKVLIAVHLYGQHAEIDRIAASCARYGVALVEDAAESLGATYRGRPTGTTAPHAILSFNGNKIITTTGGGMVLAEDPASQARMRKWANQSREPAVEYLHKEIGYNYRMSNVLAAIGRGQLVSLAERVKQRQAVFERYVRELADIEGLSFQAQAPWSTHSRWLTVAYLDPAVIDRRVGEVVEALASDNVEARPVWRPMHTQPLFKDAEVIGGAVAERLYETGICLPSSSSLSAEQQARVIANVRLALSPSTTRSR